MQIQWTDYGKVKVIDTLYQGNLSPNILNSTPSAILPKLRFKYDATGNRLEKEYVLHYKDIYLRDPQGNVMAVYRIAKDSLFLTEIPMYGEKRLGVMKENRFLMKKPTQNGIATPVIITAGKPPIKTSIYPLGKKYYETTDWLGNVRVTYTDKKSWQQNKFALNISSSQDYYPFGMLARSVRDSLYRFGFGNHEKIDEVNGSGNTIDMGDRWLDVRLGRTSKPDAKVHKYPDISPYAYVLNNPIIFVDPDGKVVVDPKTGEQVVKVNGQWQTVSGGAVSKEFVKNTQPVLDILTSTKIGTKIYEELQAIRTIVVIDLSDKENLKALKQGGNSKLRTDDGKFTTGEDGLYDKVIITPDLDKIEKQANLDNIDFEEKLIQTMSVEKDHISTKEQIAKEKGYDYNLFSSPEVVEDVYGPLLQNAVKAGIEYRKEKGQIIDDSSYLPIERVNKATGSKIPIPQ